MRFVAHPLLLSLALAATCLPGTAPAKEDEAYVIEEKGRTTLAAQFDKRMPTPSGQWTYALETRNKGRLDRAKRRFRYLVRRWPNAKEAPDAQKAYADVLYAQGELDDAFNAYQYLIDNYSDRMTDYSSVLALQFEVAQKIMKRRRMRWIFGGYKAPEYAAEYFRHVVRNGPEWPRAPEALYMVGTCYEKGDELEEAVVAFADVGYRYPDSPLAEKAAWARIRCIEKIREDFPNSPDALDRVVTATTVYLSTYPNSERNGEIVLLRNKLYEIKAGKAFDVGRFYEKVPKKPESAILAYEQMTEQFPKSKRVPKAKERIAALKAILKQRAAETATASNAPPERAGADQLAEAPDEKDEEPAPEETPATGEEQPATTTKAPPAGEETATAPRKKGIGIALPELPKALPNEPFDIQAPHMEYVNGTFVASGGVTGRFENATIYADEVRGNPDSGDLHMAGNVRFERDGTVWTGSKLDYNYLTQKGSFDDTTLKLDPVWVTADKIERVETNVVRMTGADFTTCPKAHPHYHVHVKEAEVKNRKYVKAKSATLYLGNVPVFYFPYWRHNLQDSIFKYKLGYGSRWGGYALTRTTLPLSEHVDWLTDLNAYSKRGVGVGQGLNWFWPNAEGKFRAFFLNDSDPYAKYDSPTDRKLINDHRYRYKFEHLQRFSDTHYVNTKWNYLSDPAILDEYFRSEHRENAQPENYASWVYGDNRFFGTEVFVNKRLNDFYDNTDRYEVSGDLYRSKIANTPFFFESENSIAHLERVYARTNSVDRKYETFRVDSANTLYLPQRYGFLRVVPRVGYRFIGYSNTPNLPGTEGENDVRGVGSIGMEVAFQASRILSETDRWYGQGLRHKIEPYVDYVFQGASDDHDRYYQFDDVDAIDDANKIKLGLRNVLQTRRDGRLARFIDLDLYTYYRFKRYDERDDFDSLFLNARLWITPRLVADLEGEMNWNNGLIPYFDTRVSYRKNKDVIVSLEHLYQSENNPDTGRRQSLWTPRIDLFPDQKYSLEAYVRYEDSENEMEEYAVIGYVNRCCMRYGLGYHRESDGEQRIMFSVGLSAFPSAKISTSF